MYPMMAAALVLAVLAAGEVASALTRARVPGFLVSFLALFALVQLGVFPRDIVDSSTWKTTGNLLAPALMVHLGTMIPLRIMRQQYRAVLVAVCGMAGAAAVVTAVVTLYSGMPPPSRERVPSTVGSSRTSSRTRRCDRRASTHWWRCRCSCSSSSRSWGCHW